MTRFEPFRQSPPELANQLEDDRALSSLLRRLLPDDVRTQIEPELHEMGALAGGELYRAQLEDRENEPTLVHWDAWGNRIDRIDLSPLWLRAETLAAERGIVAAAYERRHGAYSRIHQFALAYLFAPSTDVYACPLAMTDGAARTLLESGNRALIERAVPRLTTRDPVRFWTSGQWMTEATGGSDVGRSETVAVEEDGTYRLYGRKWFTSATTSQMALTLARPSGQRDLALFYVETRNAEGRLENIIVHRLKDKLGTRKVPTAELTLEGTVAVPVAGLEHGVRNIAPMLGITRIWNTVVAVAGMRRGLALARDYAQRRIAFGEKLSDKPLHLDTLASVAAETEAALQLAFFVVSLLGRIEARQASEGEVCLARFVTPIAKLVTAKQAVCCASEVLECFGGAGYVEDTGLPMLLRDAQVLPIWEGTTNVLALDGLRVLGPRSRSDVVRALFAEIDERLASIRDSALREVGEHARTAIHRAFAWLAANVKPQSRREERGARRFALTVGRSLELLLLAHHADWSLTAERDARARTAALTFSRSPFDFLSESESNVDARALAMGDLELPQE